MRRHLSIRWKVLVVLALPVLVVALACGAVAYDALGQATLSRQVGAFAAAQSNVSQVMTSLQAERLAVINGSRGETLQALRTTTDDSVRRLETAMAGTGLASSLPGGPGVLSRVDAAHIRIVELRRAQDAGDDRQGVIDGYTEIIAADVELAGRMAQVLPDRDLAKTFEAATEINRVSEASARIYLVGLGMVRARVATPVEQNRLAVAMADHDRALTAFGRSVAEVTPVLDQQEQAATQRFRGYADDLQRRENLPIGLPEKTWTAAATAQAAALRAIAADVSAAAAGQAEVAATSAGQRVALTSGVAVALVGLMVLLALMQSRTITAPLRRLAVATTRTREELPAAVAAISLHGATSAELPEVDVTARDEVGEVAAAFRTVQDTVLEIAREQGALRGALAETFVNIARRNQVLLARQLSFIDRLERTEENPESLENLFRLDHLATRMRRNAESLLVLAGIDSGRRARSPMLLSDVVRTAISEVEHYERVDLETTVNPLVVAHLALPTAHLLAELIENATLFSDPAHRVQVRSSAGADGIEVRVADRGLGLGAEDLVEINARLTGQAAQSVVPEHTEGAQRLGLFVVGRLAGRLGARVALESDEQGGTVAVVSLPPVVFVEGSSPATTGQVRRIDVSRAGGGRRPRATASGRPGAAADSAELDAARAAERDASMATGPADAAPTTPAAPAPAAPIGDPFRPAGARDRGAPGAARDGDDALPTVGLDDAAGAGGPGEEPQEWVMPSVSGPHPSSTAASPVPEPDEVETSFGMATVRAPEVDPSGAGAAAPDAEEPGPSFDDLLMPPVAPPAQGPQGAGIDATRSPDVTGILAEVDPGAEASVARGGEEPLPALPRRRARERIPAHAAPLPAEPMTEDLTADLTAGLADRYGTPPPPARAPVPLDRAEHAPADAPPAPPTSMPRTVDVLPASAPSSRGRGVFGRLGRGRNRSEPVSEPGPPAMFGELPAAAAPSQDAWPEGRPGPAVPAPVAPDEQGLSGAGAAPDGWSGPGDSAFPPPPPPVPARPAAREDRSELASTALSELSMLASYTPTPGGGQATPLARRSPAASAAAASPAAAAPAQAAPSDARSARTADGVQNTFAGFVAGSARGRERAGMTPWPAPDGVERPGRRTAAPTDPTTDPTTEEDNR